MEHGHMINDYNEFINKYLSSHFQTTAICDNDDDMMDNLIFYFNLNSYHKN